MRELSGHRNQVKCVQNEENHIAYVIGVVESICNKGDLVLLCMS